MNIDFSEKYSVSIAAVNDGSIDKTAMIVCQFAVILLSLPVNLGIGGVVQTGFWYAFKNDIDLVIQVDGDGQQPQMRLKNYF